MWYKEQKGKAKLEEKQAKQSEKQQLREIKYDQRQADPVHQMKHEKKVQKKQMKYDKKHADFDLIMPTYQTTIPRIVVPD